MKNTLKNLNEDNLSCVISDQKKAQEVEDMQESKQIEEAYSIKDEQPIIKFTQSCIDKVKELIIEEDNPNLKLRVFVTGGGCSGFQYGFAFEEMVEEDDLVIREQEVDFLVDYISYQYLRGATINYVDDLRGAQFEIMDNPNASTTCSCGSSFSV